MYYLITSYQTQILLIAEWNKKRIMYDELEKMGKKRSLPISKSYTIIFPEELRKPMKRQIKECPP